VVTREARCGEQGCACTRKGGRRYQVSGKKRKEKSYGPVEAEGTVIESRILEF